MTLTELRYITTLAQVSHFGHAAERCNVSQPTLSIAVKKLESELGVDLFERSKSSVRPTPIGEQIIAQSQRVLEEAAAIKDIATSGKDQLNSPLHVGAIFTIGPYLFPHFIPPLQKSAPQMPLVIEEGYTSTLRKRLRSGEVDVIIVALPFNEPDVVVQPLYEEPFVLLLPGNHPLAAKQEIDHSDLDGENVLMMGEGHCFRDQVIEALPNINRNPVGSAPIRTMTEGSSLETLCYMVASGLGITILPQSAAIGAEHRGNSLVTRPFAGSSPSRTTALAWRASFPRHKAIDALRNAIYDRKLPGINKS
ncbi:MAG: LysR family transcriptional regulator [Porticoccaceae bacterium]|jgi:LysR family hydrogen peroxide-inducible transcriptional activator|nr:LysR family transcriptional regulator [Porticoccaceae bacterium]MBT5577810.1 LysR family transcriptional regulator [Porticoccaceae bacterium]MBT7374410.1 LysR family transcriptional regulator [Porticoccaceae bacterium]